MRKRSERKGVHNTTFEEGGCHLSNLPHSFSPPCFCASCGQAASPVSPISSSLWCHSQPALSRSHAYCLSVYLHHFSVNCQICPWTCINFETLCLIYCFTFTCVSASDVPLNLVIRPALLTSSLRMCNFGVQSLIHFFFREKRNQRLYSNTLLPMPSCVSTEFVKSYQRKWIHNTFQEVLHAHTHTHAHTQPTICEVRSKKQAGASRDHQVCVSILQCVFVPVMWSVVLSPIDAARVPALLPFFSKWPPFWTSLCQHCD